MVSPGIGQMLRRVVGRPWPWVLRYLLTTLPAVLLASLLMLPLRSWFQSPLVAEALTNRSLDSLLDLVNNPPVDAARGSILGLALVGTLLGWIVVRGVWLWLEGGVVLTYVQATRPSPRAFVRACWRWLGSFVLLGILGWLAIGLVMILMGGLAYLLFLVGRPVTVPLFVAGAVLAAMGWVWIELARVVAVVRDDRAVIRSLGGAAQVAFRCWWRLLGLVVVLVLARVALALGSRALSSALPYGWWLLVLVIQQVVQIVVVGLALARRAGQAGLVLRVFGAAVSDG